MFRGGQPSYLGVGGTRPPDESRLVAEAAGVNAHLQPVELGVEQHKGVRPATHTETQTLTISSTSAAEHRGSTLLCDGLLNHSLLFCMV